VKSIMALHDDQADKEWVSRWAGGDWKIGLLTGLSGQISEDVSLALSYSYTPRVKDPKRRIQAGAQLTISNHPPFTFTSISYPPTLDLSSPSP